MKTLQLTKKDDNHNTINKSVFSNNTDSLDYFRIEKKEEIFFSFASMCCGAPEFEPVLIKCYAIQNKNRKKKNTWKSYHRTFYRRYRKHFIKFPSEFLFFFFSPPSLSLFLLQTIEIFFSNMYIYTCYMIPMGVFFFIFYYFLPSFQRFHPHLKWRDNNTRVLNTQEKFAKKTREKQTNYRKEKKPKERERERD